jgi:hypothetical protein
MEFLLKVFCGGARAMGVRQCGEYRLCASGDFIEAAANLEQLISTRARKNRRIPALKSGRTISKMTLSPGRILWFLCWRGEVFLKRQGIGEISGKCRSTGVVRASIAAYPQNGIRWAGGVRVTA